MKWITKILDVSPYAIKCKWNDNKIRTVDLEEFIKNKAKNPQSSYYQLLDKKRFCEVQCDGITLYWKNGIKMKDLDGKIKPAPLDIDPNVVYQLTVEPEYIE